MRALDELTVRLAAGTLPDACRWLLNTQALLLRKDVDNKNKGFDDKQWTLEEHFWEEDKPEAATMSQEEADAGMGEAVNGAYIHPVQEEALIQMGEFLRKWACQRLLQVAKPDIAEVKWTMRQLGIGAPREGRSHWLYFTRCSMRRGLRGTYPGHVQGLRLKKIIALVASSGRQSGKPHWRDSQDTSRHYAGSMTKLRPSFSPGSYFCPKTVARSRAMSTAL